MKFLTPWATWTPDRRLQPAAVSLVAIILVLLACQGGPTEAGGPGSEDPDHLDSLSITAPTELPVHDIAKLDAKAWKDGVEISPSSIVWLSLDPLIASVTSSGFVIATRPGRVRIRASMGNVAATVTLKVYALLRIQSDLFVDLPVGGLPMGVGDRVQLGVIAVDVDGAPIPEMLPSVTWTSYDPDAVSVDASGLVTTHLANRQATVIAASPDDTARVPIRVLDIPAGEPATVRIAHGIPGLGTIRFRMTPGSEVSLAYGHSVDVPILSGTLRVETEGLPRGDPTFGDPSGEFLGVIRPGDHLSLYAVGSVQSGGGFLQAVWPATAAVPSDSVLVRLIQSSPALVVYLRPHEDPRTGLPELCYFDPGNVSPYFERAAGDFDVIGQDKYGKQQEIGRVATSVAGGSAVTMVLTGGSKQPFGIMTFIDR